MFISQFGAEFRLADELSVADVRIHLIRLCFTLCDDGEAELAISD